MHAQCWDREMCAGGYDGPNFSASMSPGKLHWKDLSLDEIELVLKTKEVTGEPEDYEYIRQNGKLRVLSSEHAVDVYIDEMKAA